MFGDMGRRHTTLNLSQKEGVGMIGRRVEGEEEGGEGEGSERRSIRRNDLDEWPLGYFPDSQMNCV